MIKVELITIPGSGTRSIEKFLTKTWNFELLNFPTEEPELAKEPMVFNSTHFEPNRVSLDRLLKLENTLILSTWRDPLRTMIHNLYKGRKKLMPRFEMLYELREQKPVMMIDLRCLTDKIGEGEVLRPVARLANDGHALRKAYFNKDIAYIDKVIGPELEQLRKFDWRDLWTEDWWREL
jgi:hypothetical protein